jgi:Dictyostelium (slime mold) repeat
MNWLRGISLALLGGAALAACGGASNPSETEPVGEVSQAITAACNLNTVGFPCDPDGPAKPKLECEGVCGLHANGLVTCQVVALGALNGVACGTTSGVGDAACKRYCSGKTCMAANAPAGAACRPTSKSTPCDGTCDGAGKCDDLGAAACPFGRDEQLCTFATCNFASSAQCKTANLAKNAQCSDANACEISKCDGKGKCLAGGTVGCDDGNACTDDECDATDGGCAGVNDDTNTCSDGNACTTGDFCSSGGCVPGTVALDCNDQKVCTVDSCDPNTGCANVPKCVDSDACTDDLCDETNGGACSHPPKACNDDNPCTTDTCDGATGCVFTALNCDDNDACTADSCGAGACVHEPIVDCGAGGAGGAGAGGEAGAAGAGEGGEPVTGGSGGVAGSGGAAGDPSVSGGPAGGSSGTGGLNSGGGSTTTGGTTGGTGEPGTSGSSTGGSSSGTAAIPTAGGQDDQLPPTDNAGETSGCGCRTVGSRGSHGAWSGLALLGAVLLRRKLRRNA